MVWKTCSHKKLVMLHFSHLELWWWLHGELVLSWLCCLGSWRSLWGEWQLLDGSAVLMDQWTHPRRLRDNLDPAAVTAISHHCSCWTLCKCAQPSGTGRNLEDKRNPITRALLHSQPRLWVRECSCIKLMGAGGTLFPGSLKPQHSGHFKAYPCQLPVSPSTFSPF